VGCAFVLLAPFVLLAYLVLAMGFGLGK